MNVFFFKQKTAYEMRISDWSSDVCSSDLIAINKARDWARRRAVRRFFTFARPIEEAWHIADGTAGADVAGIATCHQRVDPMHGIGRAEIGRASGRERVCQYV